jgi:hypothetical protein
MTYPVGLVTTLEPGIVFPAGTVVRSSDIRSVSLGTGDTSPLQTGVVPDPVRSTVRRSPRPETTVVTVGAADGSGEDPSAARMVAVATMPRNVGMACRLLLPSGRGRFVAPNVVRRPTRDPPTTRPAEP